MKSLDTDRLSIRRLTVDDAGFILRLLNEESFLRNIGDRGVRTLDDARAYILTGPVASYERYGFGLFLVEGRHNQTPMGICGLLKRDGLDDADIGFAFVPEFWSQGFAFESAAAVMCFGRDVIGLPRIVAIVSPGNDRSISLLEKLGLRFERMIRWPADTGSELKLFGATF